MQKLLERIQAANMASSESEEALEVPLISFDHLDGTRGTRSETIRTLTIDEARSCILSGIDCTKEESIPFQLMFKPEVLLSF